MSSVAVAGTRPTILARVGVADPVPAKSRDGPAIGRTVTGILVGVANSVSAEMLTPCGASSIDAALAGGA